MAEVIPIGRTASGKPPTTRRPLTRTGALSAPAKCNQGERSARPRGTAAWPAPLERDTLQRRYEEALRDYLLHGGEAHLHHAYDLGRCASKIGLGVLDLVRLHHSTVGASPSREAGRTEAFLLEALSPFEAMHRGFRQAHGELRQRERQFAQAQQLASLGSFEWDRRNDRVNQSDELFRIQGRPVQRHGGPLEQFLECLHPDDRPNVKQLFAEAISLRASFQTDCRVLTPAGDLREIHLRGEVMLDSAQQPARIIGFCQDVTERRRVERELQESRAHYQNLFNESRAMEQTLRQLSKRMLNAQEQERAHLSRELHDEVGQTLNAMAMNLAALERHGACQAPEVAARISDTVHLVSRTIENVHRFARELRPAMLDELGLDPALRALVRGFAVRAGITVEFHGKLPGNLLAVDQRTVIYRVAQESLNNVAKHASATHVDVILWREGGQAILEIRDNGCGFAPAPRRVEPDRQRLGLLGMEERVRLIDGKFKIESRPGAGTIVRVEIPLAHSDRSEPEAGGNAIGAALSNGNQNTPLKTKDIPS